MSHSNVTTQQEWCNTARELLQQKQLKSGDVHNKLAALDTLMTPRPPEMSDDEWDTYQSQREDVEEAAHKGDAKTATKKFPFSAILSVEIFIGDAEKHVAKIKARQTVYEQAKTKKVVAFGKLSPKGQTELKHYDDPEQILDQAEALRGRANEIGKELQKLKDYYDNATFIQNVKTLTDAMNALDFAAAKTALKVFEALLQAAKDEKADVDELKTRHKGATGEPTTIVDWRKLAKQDRAFDGVSADIETLLTQFDDPSVKKPDSKKMQVSTVRGEIETHIANWRNDTTDIATKLNPSANTKGTVAWLQERLKLLQAPTAANKSDQDNEKAAQEWSAFISDVTKKWNHYFKHGGNRGTVAEASVLTDGVKARINTTASFSAGGKTWTKAGSFSTGGVSFHAPLPPKYLNPNKPKAVSFIYHLDEYADDDDD